MRHFSRWIWVIVSAGCAATSFSQNLGTPQKTANAVAFTENKGQWDASVRFLARTSGANLWVTEQGMTLDYHSFVPEPGQRPELKETPKGTTYGSVLRFTFENARPSAALGQRKQIAYENYFLGQDSSHWASRVGRFDEVQTPSLYDGIGIRYYFDHGSPRYDLIVKPGADPSQVSMKIDGAQDVRINESGCLELRTPYGTIEEKGLQAYQVTASGKTQVPCRMFVDRNHLRFDAGDYDLSKPLIIDPLFFSTYVGDNNSITGLKLDASYNCFVCGTAYSSELPASVGAYQTQLKGTANAFVAEISANGSQLISATYVGGSSYDQANGIAYDSSGNIWITGATDSADFPITANAFEKYAGGHPTYEVDNAFVCGLTADCTQLLASTYLGGSGNGILGDEGLAIGSGEGGMVVVGRTASHNFPVTANCYQSTNKSATGTNAFVSTISTDATQLIASTYFGGSGSVGDSAYAMWPGGGTTIAGSTSSPDLPTTQGAYQTQLKGPANAFIATIAPNEQRITMSTYFGGSGNQALGIGDSAYAIASGGSYYGFYIAGSTASSDLPVTNDCVQPTLGNPQGNAFVSQITPDGKNLNWSTYLGGSGSTGGGDVATAMALDVRGDPTITGYTFSPDFPTTPGVPQTTNGAYAANQSNAFVAKISSDCVALVYGSYVGGTGGTSGDYGQAIALTDQGLPVIGGVAGSGNFPTSQGAYQTSGTNAGFISKFLYDTFAMTMTPKSVIGGTGAYLDLLTPYGLGMVQLISNNSAVTLPGSAEGGADYSQINVDTTGVGAPVTVTITGIYNDGLDTQTVTLTLLPAPVESLTFTSPTVLGGGTVTGSIAMDGYAGPKGDVIQLASSSPYATIPANVTTGAEDAAYASFTATTKPVTVPTTVTVTASFQGSSVSSQFVVEPPQPGSLTVSPSTVLGGSGSSGEVVLTGPAGPSGAVVQLSSNSAAVAVPYEIGIGQGQRYKVFPVTTKGVDSETVATVTATCNGASQTSNITVQPASLASFSATPASLVGGSGSLEIKLSLSGPAGPSGSAILLGSNNSAISLPGSGTVLPGYSIKYLSVKPAAVSINTTVTLTAAFNGVTKSQTLTVLSAISNFEVSPPSVVGGSDSSGLVLFPVAITSGGTAVIVTSNSTNAVVPASVPVGAGNTAISFPIQTKAVKTSTSVTITVSYGGSVEKTTLTLTP